MTDGGATVVLVDDDKVNSQIVRSTLERDGYKVEVFHDGESCLNGLASILPDVVCLDIHMPGLDGLETLEIIRSRQPHLPVVMLTTDQGVESVVTAIRLGAFEYLSKPVDATRLLTVVRNAVDRHRLSVRNTELEHESQGWHFPRIAGQSPPMIELFRRIDRVSNTDVTVLVEGESGTGKELVARTIHEGSGRADGPFVAVNCAAVPESLQESELFGHEKGAFTGADQRRIGRFEQADGGTLFLDEIGELSPAAQAKVLRTLQEKCFFRVGGSLEVKSDFRLLAATHRSLDADARGGRFRQDLYFRLAVFELRVPPLRDRGADITDLARLFGASIGERVANRRFTLSFEALEVLRSHPWPGNVRELENAVEYAAVLCQGSEIGVEHLPRRVRDGSAGEPDEESAGKSTTTAPLQMSDAVGDASEGTYLLGDRTLEEIEGVAIEEALRRAGGNVSEAARKLGIGRATMYRKLTRHGFRST